MAQNPMAQSPHRRRPVSLGIVLLGVLLGVLLAGCTSAGSGKTGAGSGKTGAGTSASPTTGGHGQAVSPPATRVSGTYVALGDSFTAAPLAHEEGGSSAACLRSAQDYPALAAAALRPSSFVNVSCFGASTVDMFQAQRAGTPPQLNALSAADALVTVQVGGDDLGVSRIGTTCAALSLTNPFGNPCQKHYTAGGTDQLARAVAQTGPKVASVLTAIRQHAPHARVLLVGYPDILPVSGNGCWPELAVARGDVPYLRGIENQLNAMLAATAAAHGVTFVDTYAASVGHDACQRPGTKWVEGLIPTSLAVPLHPNALGEQAMARAIEQALR
jgi:lysophospholipase L1-like esterase